MALEDITRDTLYPTIRRFLRTNVGKPWNELYSHVCSVANAKGGLAKEIRRAISWDVDPNPFPIHPSTYFVNEDGILQAWVDRETIRRNRAKERLQTLPITQIFFVDDGKDLWYDLIELPEEYSRNKYSKLHKEWFAFNRTYEYYTVPVYEEIVTDSGHLTHGKQIGTKPVTTEMIIRNQCGKKVVQKLRKVAARQVNILKLVYNKRDEMTYAYKDLTAYVSGKSK